MTERVSYTFFSRETLYFLDDNPEAEEKIRLKLMDHFHEAGYQPVLLENALAEKAVEVLKEDGFYPTPHEHGTSGFFVDDETGEPCSNFYSMSHDKLSRITLLWDDVVKNGLPKGFTDNGTSFSVVAFLDHHLNLGIAREMVSRPN